MDIEQLKKWMQEIQSIPQIKQDTKEAGKTILDYITNLEKDIINKNNEIEKLLLENKEINEKFKIVNSYLGGY